MYYIYTCKNPVSYFKNTCAIVCKLLIKKVYVMKYFVL